MEGQDMNFLQSQSIVIGQNNKFKTKGERFDFLRKKLIYLDERDREFVAKVLIRYPEFLTSPASVKYHGNHEGGLFEHSLNVYFTAISIADDYGIKPTDVNVVACLFHDLCKVGKYTTEIVNEGDMNSERICYNRDYVGIEHGAESLRRLLTIDKAVEIIPTAWQFAIAYHMGVFGVSDTEMKNFSSMSEKYPQILLLHHADMISTKIHKL